MERLKELRTKNNYSQKDLADLLFVNQTAVSQWERGATTPSYELLQKIADIFDVTTDYLLGRSDHPNPELAIPDELKDIGMAFHRGEFEDLTQDEIDALAVIAKTLKTQRKL